MAMDDAQKPPDKPLGLHQALERYQLIQTPEELAFLQSYFHRLQGALIHGVPPQAHLWKMFAEIWDQARVAGATQMRRTITRNIGSMLDEAPPPPTPKIPPPPPIVVVEQMDREWCPDCAKEAS
jgi:hypothetical protein